MEICRFFVYDLFLLYISYLLTFKSPQKSILITRYCVFVLHPPVYSLQQHDLRQAASGILLPPYIRICSVTFNPQITLQYVCVCNMIIHSAKFLFFKQYYPTTIRPLHYTMFNIQ